MLAANIVRQSEIDALTTEPRRQQISFQVAAESSVCVNVPDVGWK